MTQTTETALDRWFERNTWGATVFTVGAPITYWLAREHAGPMGRFIAELQHSQLSATFAALLIGACVGGFGVLALWLLRKRRDVALALIGLAGLYVTLMPGVGYYMPAVGMAAGFAVGAATISGLLYRRARKSRSVTFGSAAWAGRDHLAQGGLLNDKGLYLGRYASAEGQREIYLTYDGDKPILTVGPPRSGKGRGSIVPNLLSYRGSVLVVDPKGELAMQTLGARARMGQMWHLIDPWGLIAGRSRITAARINPIDWVLADPADSIERAMILADAIVVPSSGEGKFWDEEAKSLLTGLILYVATEPSEWPQRDLPRVRDLMAQDADGLEALFAAMLNSSNPVVRATGARCLQKDERLLGSVLASAQSHTNFLDSPAVRETLSASDFQFEDLKTKPTSIYLIIPSDRLSAFDRFLRLLIQQAITANARDILIQPERPTLFLLDEMATLGKLSAIEQAYTLMPGYGMLVWGFVQSLPQLDTIYGKGAEGIISACGVLQYLGSRDNRTAEYFSKLCGVTTIQTWTNSVSKAFGSSSSNSGGGTSTTQSSGTAQGEAPRSLVLADELMTMHKGYQLLLVENLNPIVAEKIVWDTDPRFKDRGVNLRRRPNDPQQAASRDGDSPAPRGPDTTNTPTRITHRTEARPSA